MSGEFLPKQYSCNNGSVRWLVDVVGSSDTAAKSKKHQNAHIADVSNSLLMILHMSSMCAVKTLTSASSKSKQDLLGEQ